MSHLISKGNEWTENRNYGVYTKSVFIKICNFINLTYK